MELFWRLVLAHLLADFTLQTNFIAAWKRENRRGVALHSLVFFVCGAALSYRYLSDIWLVAGNVELNGWAIIVFLSIVHFIQDDWRVRAIKKNGSPDSFQFFLLDQLLHIALVFILSPRWGSLYPEKWVFLAILFILTTHFTSIFVYYVEKSVFQIETALTGEKYYLMVERFLLLVTLLLPGVWMLSSVVLAAVMVGVRLIRRKRKFTWVNMALGGSMALIFGFFARIIIYT